MHKSLTNLPVFDAAAFSKQSLGWKKLMAGGTPGSDRVVVEWSVGRGPSCFVYPAGKRDLGVNLTANTTHTQSDERWADFLEFEFVPQVVAELEREKYRPQVICADLRPVQIQRARRRTLEAAARAKTGDTVHH